MDWVRDILLVCRLSMEGVGMGFGYLQPTGIFGLLVLLPFEANLILVPLISRP